MVSRCCVKTVVDPLADRTYALPVDTHELGDCTSVAMHAQPSYLLFEGMREAGCVVGPRNCCSDYAMLGTSDAQRLVLQVGNRCSEIKRAPTSRESRAVIDGRFAIAVWTATALSFAWRHTNYQLAVFQFYGLDDGSGDAEQRCEYSFDGHRDILFTARIC